MDSSRSSNSSSSDSSSSDSNSNSTNSTLELLEIDNFIPYPVVADLFDFGFVILPNPDDLPFTNEEISSIETVSVSKQDVEEDKSCGICLLDYNVGEELRKVPCGGEHCFHEDCLFTWLQTKKTCPMCREKLKLDKDDSSQNELRSTTYYVRFRVLEM